METDPLPDFYTVLGVPRIADAEEIKQAYRSLAKRFHPDSGTDEASTERFQVIEEAYRVLSNPQQRREYDHRLKLQEQKARSVLSYQVLTSRETLPAMAAEQMFYLLLEIEPRKEVQPPRMPLNLGLVIDRSTSMNGNRLNSVKAAAHRIIDDLQDDDILSIVAFSDRAEVLLPGQVMKERARAHALVSSVWAGGGTEILQGLKAGLEQVRRFRRSDRISYLILLTDGRTYGDEEDCIAEARRAGLERIGISALGIGEDWNDLFLDRLVQQAGGVSIYVSHVQQIRQVLDEQVRKIGRLIAHDLSLTLRFSEHVWLETAFRVAPEFGYLAVEDGTCKLGSLFQGEKLAVLCELVVGQAEPGMHRLLQWELTAEVLGPPARQERVQAEVRLPVSADPPPEPVPPRILAVLSRLSIFRMQEQAWRALEEGRVLEAGKRLESVATRLLDIGEYELAQMALLEAGRVAQGAEVSKKGYKTIRYGTRGLGIRTPG